MFPVSDQPQRFGNAAYRSWFEKMSNESASMCEKILPEELKAAAVELSAYWSDSFGNKSRIDYGTGHEMNFFVFLFCVEKAYQLHKSAKSNSEGEQTKPEDDVLGAMITIVFTAYMDLVRKLQLTYRMEPAGYYFKNSCFGQLFSVCFSGCFCHLAFKINYFSSYPKRFPVAGLVVL